MPPSTSSSLLQWWFFSLELGAPNKKPFLPVIILEISGEIKQTSIRSVVEISCPKRGLKPLNSNKSAWLEPLQK